MNLNNNVFVNKGERNSIHKTNSKNIFNWDTILTYVPEEDVLEEEDNSSGEKAIIIYVRAEKQNSNKTIKQIQDEYKGTSDNMLPAFIEEYIKDGRPGVSKIISQAQKKIMKLQSVKRDHSRVRTYCLYAHGSGL